MLYSLICSASSLTTSSLSSIGCAEGCARPGPTLESRPPTSRERLYLGVRVRRGVYSFERMDVGHIFTSPNNQYVPVRCPHGLLQDGTKATLLARKKSGGGRATRRRDVFSQVGGVVARLARQLAGAVHGLNDKLPGHATRQAHVDAGIGDGLHDEHEICRAGP